MTEDATDGRPGPPAPPRPPAPLAIPDLDGPPAAAAVAPAADGVTDEDRTRFGLLLDRAAERGLLSTSEYQLRLGDLAEATTIDQMRQIVTELPVFNTPVTGTVAKGSRRSTAVPALGAPSPRAGGRGRSGRWVLLAIVVIAVEAHERGAGRVRLGRVKDTTAETLIDYVLANVKRGSIIHTDGLTSYNDIGKYQYTHVVTNMSDRDTPAAHVAMPHAHRVASLLKRWLLGTHQGGMSREQLDYYLDEYVFRFNRRASRSRGLLFYRLIEQGVVTDPHPYKALLTPQMTMKLKDHRGT